MACSTQRSEQIAALAAGRLDASAADDLLGHLAGCKSCSDELDIVADLAGGAARNRGLFATPEHAPARRRLWTPLLAAAAVVLGLALWQLAPSDAVKLADLASIDPLPVPEVRLRTEPIEPRGPRYREAMDDYARGDYAAAATALREIARHHPEDALVHLYLGISELQIGAAQDAANALDSAARHGTELLQERSLWYLAAAHLLRADGEGALRALERLRDLGGDYELNARTKIDEIRRVLDP